MLRLMVRLGALCVILISCWDATGPACDNLFVGSLSSDVTSDSRVAGCATFYVEQPGNRRWIVEMREDGTTGQWLNVLHPAPGPAVGSYRLGPGSAFIITIAIPTTNFTHTFSATSGNITITDVSDRVRGRVDFVGHETTRGTNGTRTVRANVRFVAICSPTQFQSC